MIRKVLPLLLSLFLSACSGSSSGSTEAISDRPIRAVVTTGMVGDVVHNVGGERVEISQLMQAGVDPHLYKASEGDVQRLAGADIIFYNGLHLEARLTDVLAQMDQTGKPTVAIAEGVPEEELLAPPEFAGFHDPHVWMDVKMWLHTIDPVRDALIELDPDHAEQYRANAEEYRTRLQALESYVQQRVQELPAERRMLVTAHDAFNYFSKGYEFDVFAPQGISTETEASVEDIRSTIDVLVERNVPALFAESTISPDIIKAVQEGAKARGHEVTIAGPLYTDAMGNEGTPEGTYEGMIRFNIDTIVDALK
ncbi:MAG: zinc ABC transporter substrate-binding protein [Ardenticatenales bacterium]|nr:zinc ABC transporter substrate-binding protein [Ardenticatenales bacterium]